MDAVFPSAGDCTDCAGRRRSSESASGQRGVRGRVPSAGDCAGRRRSSESASGQRGVRGRVPSAGDCAGRRRSSESASGQPLHQRGVRGRVPSASATRPPGSRLLSDQLRLHREQPHGCGAAERVRARRRPEPQTSAGPNAAAAGGVRACVCDHREGPRQTR